MATAAVGAELVIVRVVRPMTISALGAGTMHHAQSAAMTVIALHLAMRAIQYELCLCVVIKQP